MDDDPHVEAAMAELTRAKRRATMRVLAFVLIGALVGLGYRPQQAAQAVEAMAGATEGRTLDELLRDALKRLRG